jgi:hypothetical protein
MADLTVFVNDSMTVEDVVEHLVSALRSGSGAASGDP